MPACYLSCKHSRLVGSALEVDPVVGSIPGLNLGLREAESQGYINQMWFPFSLGLGDISSTCGDEKWMQPSVLSGEPGTSCYRGRAGDYLVK